MLHILLFIFKIAGIILAVILGILILLVCIALFIPVRYELSGTCEGDMESLRVKISVTWFLHLIRADICYKKKKLMWRVRAAWIKKRSGQIKEETKHEETDQEEAGYKETEYEEAPEILESKEEILKECEESRYEPEKSKKENAQSMETASREEPRYAEAVKEPQEQEETAEERKKIRQKIQGFIKKIKSLFQKIKCTFQNLCDKIKTFLQKKDRLMEFISDEVHKGAFRKVIKEIKHLLKRLVPGKLTADVHYGFDDPCTTGKVLAGLGMLYPFIGEHVQVMPDFENRVLEGNVYIKGKIHGYYFFVTCWNLIWCRNVRMTYRHIKNFEL